jgi:clan AA aspartic protease
MIGRVERLHALIPVSFRFSDKPDITIEYVVDTGYTGYLTMPVAAVVVLGLPFEYDLPANLADDSEALVPVHSATIQWNGVEQTVRVLAMGKRPLLGTAMLDGNELLAQFAESGLVTIDTL